MKKYFLFLLLFLAPVGGCSSLGATAGAALLGASSGGIETELTVGAKSEEVVVNTHIGSGERSYAIQTIEKVEQVPALFIFLLILGWLLPSPSEMWAGFARILPWRTQYDNR